MKLLYRTLLLLFIVGNGITASAQKITTAIDLNDHMVSITDSLYEAGQAWGTKFKNIRASKQFSELAYYRRKIESLIERKRLEVLNLKDIGGSEKLRLAMLDFLAYESNMIKEAFVPLEKLSTSATEEQISKAIERLSKLAENEADYLKKVNDVQHEYAAKNGFTIEEPDEE